MKGFNLLELMTVVAIIALLSTLAIPTYQNYMLKGRLTPARAYLDSFNGKVEDFYSNHGTFPNNTDLGISSAVPTSSSNYLFPKYLAYITMEPQTTTGSQCPYSINTAYLSNYAGDYYSDGSSPYITFSNYFIDNKGNMNILCYYQEYNATTRQDVFPECASDLTAIMNMINTACA